MTDATQVTTERTDMSQSTPFSQNNQDIRSITQSNVATLSALLGIAPRSYVACSFEFITTEYLHCIVDEHRMAFSPPPSRLHHHSPQIRMQQLDQFDVREKQVLVLTRTGQNYLDAIHQSKAKRITQISARSLLGPIEIECTKHKKKIVKQASIDDLYLFIEHVDYLWIPDPYLASLIFRSADLTGLLSQRIRTSMIFPINICREESLQTRDMAWTDNKIRSHLHANGFLEISNTADAEGVARTTRYHEAKAFYSIDGNNRDITRPVLRLYAAQKKPSTKTMQE
jgi:hypothetical protein